MTLFITVGSTGFPYDRVLSALDSTLISQNRNIKLLVQAGKSTYKWKYKSVTQFDFLTPNRIIDHIKKADKIITHGGPISVYLAVQYGKNLPLVLPRLAQFSEHVDNHQLFFCSYLKSDLPLFLKNYFCTKENVATVIDNYLSQKSKKNTLSAYLFKPKSSAVLIKKISQFISKDQ